MPRTGAHSKVSVTRISLPALESSAHEARDRLGSLLSSWRNQAARDDAMLVLSEVVTNAIRHVHSGPILITVTLRRGHLLAAVRDESASVPTRRSADERGGWGLELLEVLSDRWGGHEHLRDGKTIWFEMQDANPKEPSRA